ncbi:MAG: hypothetical protein EKK64_02050 [Neisseriaceae bacterium]|nr:MAG: hypothetical protein EKK64_02050 [Neisseriaceae bacterium]
MEDLRKYLTVEKEWDKIPNSLILQDEDDLSFSSFLNKSLGIQVVFSIAKRNREPKSERCLFATVAPIKVLRKDINDWSRYLKINSTFVLKEFAPNVKFILEEEKESKMHFYSLL